MNSLSGPWCSDTWPLSVYLLPHECCLQTSWVAGTFTEQERLDFYCKPTEVVYLTPFLCPSLLKYGCLFAGIPSEQEYIEIYCQARGIAVPDPTTYAFCQALSMFRIAAILAGVGARAQLGNASSKHAAEVRSLLDMHADVKRYWQNFARHFSAPSCTLSGVGAMAQAGSASSKHAAEVCSLLDMHASWCQAILAKRLKGVFLHRLTHWLVLVQGPS